jgi:hypothetical protein
VGLDQQPLNLHIRTVTILNGASLSDAADLRGLPLVGVVLPAGYDTADLTFQGSADGDSFADLYDRAGNELKLTGAAASRYYVLAPGVLPGLRYIKVRSGTAGTPVAQTSDVVLTLIARLVV